MWVLKVPSSWDITLLMMISQKKNTRRIEKIMKNIMDITLNTAMGIAVGWMRIGIQNTTKKHRISSTRKVNLTQPPVIIKI